MRSNYFFGFRSIELWEEIIFLAFGRTSLVQVMRTFFSALLPTSLARANIFFKNNFSFGFRPQDNGSQNLFNTRNGLMAPNAWLNVVATGV